MVLASSLTLLPAVVPLRSHVLRLFLLTSKSRLKPLVEPKRLLLPLKLLLLPRLVAPNPLLQASQKLLQRQKELVNFLLPLPKLVDLVTRLLLMLVRID